MVMLERYEVCVVFGHVYRVLAELDTIHSELDHTWKQVLYYRQVFFSRFWNETVLFTNFHLSIFESIWSSLYQGFTGNCFNCLRRLLSFLSTEQIFLNLMTCPYVIDLLYTLRWHDCAWRCWCVSLGWQ